MVDRLPTRLARVPSLAHSARFWQQYVAWHRRDRALFNASSATVLAATS
jgi:hypothetical protein